MNTLLCFVLINFIFASASDEAKQSLLPDKDICGSQNSESNLTQSKTAGLGEFPWLALLRYKYIDDGSDAGYLCLGSLINSRYVLTSAACAKPSEIALFEVRLGEYNFLSDPDCSNEKEYTVCAEPAQNFQIENKIIHDDFNRSNSNNDIGLIRLNKEVSFTDTIKPICLPHHEHDHFKSEDVMVTSGWGRSLNGELITIQKKIFSSVITNEECTEDYKQINKTITDNHLCIRRLTNNTEYICAGDSGGPLMFSSGDKWYQEGIVSFGAGCGSKHAGGNTKVVNYLNWIRDNILL